MNNVFFVTHEGIFCGTDAVFSGLPNKIIDIRLCCKQIRDVVGVVESPNQNFNSFFEGYEHKGASLGLSDSVQSKHSEMTGNCFTTFWEVLLVR